MITEEDLKAAIAECQGQRNPNSNTCIKLAAYYTIYDHMYGKGEAIDVPPMPATAYSYKAGYTSDSEFMQAVENTDMDSTLRILDELMETLKAVQPRLYQAVIRKLNN